MRYVTGAIFAIAAFLLVMMCMPHTGAIYTHDTQSYEYAASTLLESGEIRYFGYDTPIIQWPPFYILIAAFIRLIGIPLAQGAAWVNAVAFAYLLYASALFLMDQLKVKWLAVPALLLMTASVPLVFVSGYAWTEMTFIFLSVLSVIFMLQYFEKDKKGWFYASAVMSSLCWLTRYVGVVVVAVLSLMLFIKIKPFVEKMKNTFIYLFISCIPMALWVARNYLISETFTGGRQPGIYTLEENMELSLEVFKSWTSWLNPLFTCIATAFFLFLVILAAALKKEKKKKVPGSLPALFTFILYIAGYSAVILASATASAMDPISTRLWAPVFPIWIYFMVFLMDILVRRIKTEKLKKWMAAGFTLFALTALVNPVAWIKSEALPRKDILTGSKEAPEIKNSPVIALVCETLKPSEDILVISNEASILAMHTGFKCYYPPKKTGIPLYLFDRYNERTEDFKSIYLVWVGDMESESFMDIPVFREKYEMTSVARNNCCTIFRIR